MAVEHTDLNVGSNDETKAPVVSAKGGSRGVFATTKCDPRTGQWARVLHLQAGGCEKTTGDKRLVL